jgi:hypothetical protein
VRPLAFRSNAQDAGFAQAVEHGGRIVARADDSRRTPAVASRTGRRSTSLRRGRSFVSAGRGRRRLLGSGR